MCTTHFSHAGFVELPHPASWVRAASTARAMICPNDLVETGILQYAQCLQSLFVSQVRISGHSHAGVTCWRIRERGFSYQASVSLVPSNVPAGEQSRADASSKRNPPGVDQGQAPRLSADPWLLRSVKAQATIQRQYSSLSKPDLQ